MSKTESPSGFTVGAIEKKQKINIVNVKIFNISDVDSALYLVDIYIYYTVPASICITRTFF